MIGITGAAAQINLAVSAISGGLTKKKPIFHNPPQNFTKKDKCKGKILRQEAEIGLAEERGGDGVAGDEAGGESRPLDDGGGESVVASGHQDRPLLLD